MKDYVVDRRRFFFFLDKSWHIDSNTFWRCFISRNCLTLKKCKYFVPSDDVVKNMCAKNEMRRLSLSDVINVIFRHHLFFVYSPVNDVIICNEIASGLTLRFNAILSCSSFFINICLASAILRQVFLLLSWFSVQAEIRTQEDKDEIQMGEISSSNLVSFGRLKRKNSYFSSCFS